MLESHLAGNPAEWSAGLEAIIRLNRSNDLPLKVVSNQYKVLIQTNQINDNCKHL